MLPDHLPPPPRAGNTQAVTLATVADAVLRADDDVTAYEFFSLRDTRTDASWSSRFGLLSDDYTQSRAFRTFRELVARYGMAPA